MALLAAVGRTVPLATAPQGEQAWDVESGPGVAEAAEAMQLTGRIDLVGASPMQGGPPVDLKPMNREQVSRMRDARPPSKPPPTLQPVVRSTRVPTGPIIPAPIHPPPPPAAPPPFPPP